jgi:predicted nucleotidyltransferase
MCACSWLNAGKRPSRRENDNSSRESNESDHVAEGTPTRYGSRMSSDKVPAELLQAVVEYFDPRRIILFGSRARGDAREESDHDLLVVVDDDVPADKLHWRSLHEARRRYRKAVDIVTVRQSTFDDQADVVGTLPHMAATEGVVVFDRGHRARAAG